MRSRWFSTFTILGVILLILGIVGVIVGPRFVFDPGQVADGKEAWYYMIVGALMVLNGLVAPAPSREDESENASSSATPTGTRPVAKATPRVVATAADKPSSD